MSTPYLSKELLFMCCYRISTLCRPLCKFAYQNQCQGGKNSIGKSLGMSFGSCFVSSCYYSCQVFKNVGCISIKQRCEHYEEARRDVLSSSLSVAESHSSPAERSELSDNEQSGTGHVFAH